MASDVGHATQTCVLDTEHTLDTETTAGVYQLVLDFKNAVKGDVFIVRHKYKVLTGSTAAEIAGWQQTVAHDFEAGTVVVCPPVPSLFSYAVSIEQTDGTGRDVDWTLIRIDA